MAELRNAGDEINLLRKEIEELHEAVEAAGLEYREDDGPRPYWRNLRAMNAECDADKLEKIADSLAAVIRMMGINDRIRAGELGSTVALDGDFVRRERDAAMAAWGEYQDGFKHRGEAPTPEPVEVNNWEVLKTMSARNMDIGLAPLSNVEGVTYSKRKGGSLVRIGFPGNILGKIARGGYLGGLILADAEQYEQVRKELEAARG